MINKRAVLLLKYVCELVDTTGLNTGLMDYLCPISIPPEKVRKPLVF